MSGVFAQHQLFEPFAMQALPNQGQPLQMTGMFRISEAKLTVLGADQLKELVQKNRLACVYAHLLSLANFDRLLGRRAALTLSATPEQTVAKNKFN
jgi:hypothetical protein